MEFRTRYFLFPKKNCAPSECEDGVTVNLKNLRFSVSDGASDAFDSRRWARLLNAAWKQCSNELLFNIDHYENNLALLANRWRRSWTQKELPWYAEAKLLRGTYAAFLGFEIRKNVKEYHWQSVSVGDCCLFILQEGKLLTTSFPIVSPDEFGSSPYLISTNKGDLNSILSILKQKTGVLNCKDEVLLMSDSIAQWYLKHVSINIDKQAEFLQILRTGDRYKLFILIEKEREINMLKNDDIALIYIYTR